MPHMIRSQSSPATEHSQSPRAAQGSEFLVGCAEPGQAAAEAARLYVRLARQLLAGGLEIVQERVFGSVSIQPEVLEVRRAVLKQHGINADGPFSYVEGRPPWGTGFAGVILHAIRGAEVRTILDSGRPCGRAWQTGGSEFVVLQDLRSRESGDTPRARARQSWQAIARAARVLHANGLDFRDTARTWFYLAEILDWYGPFNDARTRLYRRLGLFTPGAEGPRLPASTGICAKLPGGAACGVDLIAVRPTDAQARFAPLRNPLQAEAYTYGSAFSRCTFVDAGSSRLIELSGTAAIDEHGRSVYPGDVRAQVRCTLEKVTSLLSQVHATPRDITAATIFMKNGRDLDAVRGVLADLGLSQLPAVFVRADVCREDLRFEIDAEAMISLQRAAGSQ